MEFALIGASAFILSVILTPLAIKTAFAFGIVDKPLTKLKKHSNAMPYLGGAAMYLAFIITVTASKLIMEGTVKGVYGIVIGASIMTVMGLVDDIKRLNPYIKLGGQLLVALLIIKADMHIKFMDSNIINHILTVLWIVGITNALNIIDIMDGLASGVAAVASVAFFIVALLAGRVNDMIPAMALFGAVSAFLIYNRPPAKIYMGDAGSLFLGFVLAAIALNESYSRVNYIAVLAPILILGVPIFDTFLVMFLRMRKGLLPIYGSDDHLAQRLVMIGFSRKQATVFLVLLTAALSAVAITTTFLTIGASLVIYLIVAFAALMLAMLVTSVDMKDFHKVYKKRK
ncbi:MAG: MraY family glycosyltransferase [Candidatus Goldiibacteriota bacterium]